MLLDDKDIAIGVLKQQRNQALDALADMVVQATKQSREIAELQQRIAGFETTMNAEKHT